MQTICQNILNNSHKHFLHIIRNTDTDVVTDTHTGATKLLTHLFFYNLLLVDSCSFVLRVLHHTFVDDKMLHTLAYATYLSLS